MGETTADRVLFSGWGGTSPTVAHRLRATSVEEVSVALTEAGEPGADRGLIPRGLGRSYGDAAQCAGGRVLDCTGLTGPIHLDPERGVVTAPAGTAFADLIAHLLPRGYFPPVVPGTRHVTLGGAVAADIHGKNHHVDSSIGAHIRSLRLVTPDGCGRHLSPDHDPDLLWATVGGMGLTGVITEVELAALPVTSGHLRVDTLRLPDLDAAFAAMSDDAGDHRYSVAWLDLLARGRHLGRGVLTRANHADHDELPLAARRGTLRYAPTTPLAVPVTPPLSPLTPLSVAAFNTAYFHRAPRRRQDEPQTITRYFHPLDGVGGWNRLYGSAGLLQYQCAVPHGAESVLRRIVETCSRARVPAFLAVLKRLGPPTPGPLSFPLPGWTLALDLPAGLPGASAMLTHFDTWVAAAGGRVYLAKDARTHPDSLAAMYPRLPEWRRTRHRVDPHRRLTSDLARRLELR
ncbi:FAD-binding oxidoreductase [Spiractinospora alimapuensis]|uniref:FAD-binding protein n=1 Tax=Spiractinospora alimapuensis TaxID=2820884 RepID=UPI001F2134DF|nr:FAD-binding oxidoreductase [Spiractinospora alimapuensis]QVQ54293.1 FAD-binding oxidoreductase [Spiractinospora alimapuensis]